MKFFKYDDRIVEHFKDCEDHVINSSTFVNYDQIKFVRIIENMPYFTVCFSDDNIIEIDKKHLNKFLEGLK